MLQRHLVSILCVSLLCAASPARAGITPEAAPVLERFVVAAGGRAAFESTRTMHYDATLKAFGLEGKVAVWTQAPDKRASDLSLGPFNLKEGCDGAVGWRTDPSGKLLMLDGKDLEDARASTWFENERWLAEHQGGGSIRHDGVQADSTGRYDVLEVTPPVGRPRRLWFDQRTGLHQRTVSRNDQQTTVSTFSDWRTVGTRKVAFHSLQSVQGLSLNTLIITVDSAWVNQDVSPTRFAPPSGSAAPVTWLKTPDTAHLPFEYIGKHVWLKASINGAPPADFIYDTGASLTVIDSAYAAANGIASEGRLQGQGAGAVSSGAFGRIQSVRVASADGDGVELKDLRIAVLNVNGFLEPFFWRPCAGIIGFDVLNKFVNQIDYDQRVISLFDPATFKYAGAAAPLPITLDGHVPVVRVTLDGTYEGGYRLDVGSSSTVDLHGPYVAEHQLENRAGRTINVMGGGFGGTFVSRLGRMQTLQIGPHTWNDPLVVLSGAGSGAFSSVDYAGNIGNGILQRFKVTLDYERRLLYLEPGARYAERDVFSRSGLLLIRQNDAIEVGQVLAEAPAGRAGIRTYDRVLSVDGRPPMEMGLQAVNDVLERGAVGRKVKVEIERDGKRMKKSFTLAEVR